MCNNLSSTLLGSEKTSEVTTIYRNMMVQRLNTLIIKKHSLTFRPSSDTDNLSIITVRTNRQNALARCRLEDEKNGKREKRRLNKDALPPLLHLRWWKLEELQLLRPLEFNPLTPKIWLLILPSSCHTFPCKLVTRICSSIEVISCTWWV